MNGRERGINHSRKNLEVVTRSNTKSNQGEVETLTFKLLTRSIKYGKKTQ